MTFEKACARAIAALVTAIVAALPVMAGSEAAQKPLSPETLAFLELRNVRAEAPVYIRIFKEESELEIWKARSGGRYVHVKTYPICNWSGALGPKETQGDQMAPEGFYNIGEGSLKPDSKYHLAMNVGYPNALDRALKRSGAFIMVHGDCKSVGCFAMTDDKIEEIYAFAREAIAAGQVSIPVHIFPFRMSQENLKRHPGHPAQSSWIPLKEAYDDFTRSRLPPHIGMCSKRYVVNPVTGPSGEGYYDPNAACPIRTGKLLAPLSKRLTKRLVNDPIVVEGKKYRTIDNIAAWDPTIAAEAKAQAEKAEEHRKNRQGAEVLTIPGTTMPVMSR